MIIEGKKWVKNKWVDSQIADKIREPRVKKPKVSGIYAIEVPSLRLAYIGQSINIQSRWSQWRHVLNRKKCEIKEMQRCWDSGNEFVFKVLLETETDLLTKERDFAQQYIDQGYDLFNTYFLVNPKSMLMNEEDIGLVAKLLKLIQKGRINREQFEQYLDNL